MTLWGGRFEDSMSESAWAFTTDESDRRLLVVDIEGSMAHAEMLADRGLIDPSDARKLRDGLSAVRVEAETGIFEFAPSDEDVHTAVERRLGEMVGAVAGKLHTGRSRNDQVVLDLRLYLSQATRARVRQLHALANTLATIAEGHADTVVPSYTHLQQAQPTTLGHHLLAYAWMLVREAERFADALKRIEVSPLGAGASSGSSLPLDREAVAAAVGFEGVIPNSLDAVGARDFVAEYVFCCVQSMVDLSRLAEEIVLWSTEEFGWVRLSDRVSTGSSALPQKRNPDIAELIRGRAAAVSGDMAAILALQKGLPLTYNRDFQEDKRLVFHADDALGSALAAMRELAEGLEFDPPAPGAETISLDLSEALVRRGVPFREAHQIVGELLFRMESQGQTLADATIDDLEAADDRFEPADLALLDPVASVSARATTGSGSPESVREQVEKIRRLIG